MLGFSSQFFPPLPQLELIGKQTGFSHLQGFRHYLPIIAHMLPTSRSGGEMGTLFSVAMRDQNYLMEKGYTVICLKEHPLMLQLSNFLHR